jgi:hypothetical protein
MALTDAQNAIASDWYAVYVALSATRAGARPADRVGRVGKGNDPKTAPVPDR